MVYLAWSIMVKSNKKVRLEIIVLIRHSNKITNLRKLAPKIRNKKTR